VSAPFEPVVKIAGLHVTLHRDGVAAHVLRGVDLEIARGEIVALVGESGSGKSTLGLAIQGLLAQEADPMVQGSIQVDGVEVVGATGAALRSLRREKLGAVFQDPSTSLDPTMRVGRQLDESIHDETVPETWLETVGIPDPTKSVRSYPHQLSGGQRQRAMIAMAMAHRPAVIVADEPTTALDVTVQSQILKLFSNLRSEFGAAILFVTHDLAVASSIADRVVVMYAGRIVESGSSDEVIHRPGHPYTVALLTARLEIRAAKDHQLPVLAGEPPSPAQLPSGCAFAPRCPLADGVCKVDDPGLSVSGRSLVACHHVDLVDEGLWERGADTWPASSAGDPGRVLSVNDVVVRYHGRRSKDRQVVALDRVSLDMSVGESVAVVGESGSGKSTLLRVVAGLIKPDMGEVTYRGEGRPQMVYQDAAASLTPWLSVGELVGERLRRPGISGVDRRAAVLEALGNVGLSPELARVKPAELSGGQRQRVAIARAIVVPPRLLLCDEPTSALDVSLAAGILNLLGVLRRTFDMATLFVTHDLAAARYVANRIVVLREGVVVEHGPADRIVKSPQHPYTVELLASMPGRPLEEAG
jgi:peptide/nickel transport system ATP-binding protein